MIPYFLHWHPLAHFLSKDINSFIKSWRNQFLGFFLQLHCFLLLIPNLSLFCYSFLPPLFFSFIFLLLFPFLSFLSFFFSLCLSTSTTLVFSTLVSTLLWTPHHLYLSCSLMIIVSKLWYFQNYTSLLPFNYINIYSFSMFLIINIYFHSIFHWFFFVKCSIHISYIYWPLNIFQFKFLFFFCKLWTHNQFYSNNTSTITPSYISILSSPILTITALNISLLSRL